METKKTVQYGVPQFAVDELERRGITKLEPLQEKAVRAGLFKGENLLIMAPTSSGKTLVGELAAMQHVTSRAGAIILTSLKAIAYEKYLTLRESYSREDNFFCHTTIATGDEVTEESIATSISLTVATYEKWYHLLLERPDRIQAKSLVIIDELQMIGDQVRGGVLEALLTWIKLKAPETQLIGLSATIPNPSDIGGWLNAKVVGAERRPVPLVEQIWDGASIYEINREIDQQPRIINQRPHSLGTLSVVRTLEQENSLPIIVFCVTKNDADTLARQAAESRRRRPDNELLINELDDRSEANPVTRSLRNVLPKGIAFHTANLGLDERRLIEEAYRTGKIDLIFATPTLSAGVNLPVKTVVFDNCYRSWIHEYISNSEYINMAGRAGRRGLQEQGRSVLLARNGAELERYKAYLHGRADRVESSLTGQNLSRVILQALVAGIAKSESDLTAFFNASFHGHTSEDIQLFVSNEIPNSLSELEENEMITRESNRQIGVTELGKVTAATGILPQSGKLLYDRLTGISSTFEWSRRDQYEKRVLLLATACRDLAPSTDDQSLLFVHRNDSRSRITANQDDFIGLANKIDLEDVLRSILTAIVCWRYINKDSFTDLLRISGYSSAANTFRVSRNLAWMLQAAASIEEVRGEESNPELRRWLRRMARRLEYGATDEAVELCMIARLGDVKGLGRRRAQLLADRGYDDLSKLLAADIQEIVQLIGSTLRANTLRKAVVLYLDQPSMHWKVEHMNRASAIGRDPQLIRNVYDAYGTAFNRAMLALLRTAYVDAREEDLGGTSEPDLAIPLADGLLVMECKTKRSEEGTVNLHDAFSVQAKAAHLQPVGMVTVGKPAFDRLAIERANGGGICLVTHITLCEAIIRIWEGALTPEVVITSLRTPGYLEIKDLDSA